MPPAPPEKTALAAKWAKIAAVLAALILVLDFFTKSIGLISTLQSIVYGNPEPVVLIREKTFDNSSSCLEFAFSSLPENFVLGDIDLDIIASEGPNQISGDMASEVFERVVNQELSPAFLVGQRTEITISASTQATKAHDAFYVHYCPTLVTPGTTGAITVVPTFLDLGGEVISPLEVKLAAGTPVEDGVRLTLVRPKNEVVTLDNNVQGPLP